MTSVRLSVIARVSGLLACLLALGQPSWTLVYGAEAGREVGRVKVKTLEEVSGIAASRRHPGILWMHNDGEVKQVYAVRTSGKLAAMVSLPEKAEDVEDVAIGPGPEEGVDYVYLGDVGDNDARRREVRVIRFAEPSLGGKGGRAVMAAGVEVFRLTYPDGPHDAEALMVDGATGDLFIATKEHQRARLYTAPGSSLRGSSAVPLTLVASLAVDQVSGGDISRDGSLVVLRREEGGWLWQRQAGERVAAAMARSPEVIPVLGPKQGSNGESIALAPDGQSYYTLSEGKRETICAFSLAPAEIE